MSSETKITVTGRFVGGGLFEPRADANNADKLRYNACVVLDDGEAAKIEKAVEAAIREKWGNKRPAGLQNWGLREGDDPEYEFSYQNKFINPKSTSKPKVLRREDGMLVEVSVDEHLVYAGCYGAVSVIAYAYDGDRKKGIKPGITLGLRAFMFTKHGEPLGDRLDAESEFSGIETSYDNDDKDSFLGNAA